MALRMGNSARVVIFVLGILNLKLPSKGFCYHISFEECNYVPCILKNSTLNSYLDRMGYTLNIKNKCFSFHLESKLVAMTLLTSSLHLIDGIPIIS